MSLETLLQAAEFVESSSGPNKKENTSNPRGNLSSNVLVDRRRVVSESDASERRRRPGGAGTRETHNKLEKNRRAHLKECFDILKKQVPTLEEKKTSNLNILRSALKYIQTMKKQEQDYVTQVDVLKGNNKSLLERLGTLKGKAKSEVNEQSASSTSTEIKQSSLSKKPTSLPSESLDSRILPISVATQTSPNLDKEGAAHSSAAELEESGRNTCVSTSSTDTGVEGDESDRKISICEEDDEKTDTDEDLNDEDNDQDIEIDVVGPDDSSSSDSLQLNVESNEGQCEVNGAIDEEKKNLSGETRCRNTAKFNRKRSKSEVKCEEDSDYDENTKEEPKSKIQACARVSV